MADYEPVKKALASGAEPEMLCATCPWDRNCVNPPSMTSADIEQQLKEAGEQDEQAMKANPGAMPAKTLLAVAVYAGRDTALQACPVLGLRLRSGDGRRLADKIRSEMQAWSDR